MYHIELYVFYRLLLTCTFYNSVLVTVHIHATFFFGHVTYLRNGHVNLTGQILAEKV